MYKFDNGQISIYEFGQPIGMNVREDNRWVKKAVQNSDDEVSDDSSSNGGTMIVDATCAPSQIKYPQDTALLNEARENTEAAAHPRCKEAPHLPQTRPQGLLGIG